MADPAESLANGHDELVAASADIDRFCSTADWILPAHNTWGQGQPLTAAGRAAAIALAASRSRGLGLVLSGLDPIWGFACPLVGPDVIESARLLADVLDGLGRRWDVVAVTGLAPGSQREHAVVATLGLRYPLYQGPAMTRRMADLAEGVDAWMARRSPRFRRNLRQAEHRCERAGVTIQLVEGGGTEVVERCAAVEARSWKGQESSGLVDGHLLAFYRRMAARLEARAGLRAAFARRDDADVGYILGAVSAAPPATYRGLQLSYDDAYAPLSLGNILQLAQMRALQDEGVVTYDLGMDMDYKRHWSDRAFTTHSLIAARRGERRGRGPGRD